jgi:hypothetical protein
MLSAESELCREITRPRRVTIDAVLDLGFVLDLDVKEAARGMVLVRLDSPEARRDVGTVGDNAASLNPSSSSTSKPRPYSTPNPGDEETRRTDVLLDNESSDDQSRV